MSQSLIMRGLTAILKTFWEGRSPCITPITVSKLGVIPNSVQIYTLRFLRVDATRLQNLEPKLENWSIDSMKEWDIESNALLKSIISEARSTLVDKLCF